jgi:hypothetical protein
MNLQESIRRILREIKQVRDMLQPANPKGKLHHYSTYKNRKSIQKNGLIPQVGKQTANYMSHNFPDVEPLPMVFAQNPEHGNFFGVYGSDLWEIDLDKIGNDWYYDPIHKDDENNWGFFVTLDSIPPSAIRLISSDEQRDDDMEIYRQTGEYPKRNTEPEEPQPKEEPNKWDNLLSQFGDDEDYMINLDDLKESKKRVLTLENKGINSYIRRRFHDEDLEEYIIDSIDYVKSMMTNRYKRKNKVYSIDDFIRITISVFMDSIHLKLHSTSPDGAEWYDPVFSYFKNLYGDRIKKEYQELKNKLV